MDNKGGESEKKRERERERSILVAKQVNFQLVEWGAKFPCHRLFITNLDITSFYDSKQQMQHLICLAVGIAQNINVHDYLDTSSGKVFADIVTVV